MEQDSSAHLAEHALQHSWCRQGLDLLENLLSNWAVWQQQTYSQVGLDTHPYSQAGCSTCALHSTTCSHTVANTSLLTQLNEVAAAVAVRVRLPAIYICSSILAPTTCQQHNRQAYINTSQARALLRCRGCVLQGYTADQQLLSGKLALDVQQLCEDGVVGWLDTMAPVPGTGQRQQQAAQAAAFKEVRQPCSAKVARNNSATLRAMFATAVCSTEPGKTVLKAYPVLPIHG